MLLYNHNKEFLGIDEEDLRLLGYHSFSELLNECHDFADLFVKKPGYIHNFKNFQWIDFVLHAEAEESKAIIHAKGRSFSCQIVIKSFYLSSTPNEEAFTIELKHIVPLSSSEDAEIAASLSKNPIVPPKEPFKAPEIEPVQPAEKVEEAPKLDADFPSFDDVETTELAEPDMFDVPDSNPTAFDPHDSQEIEKEYADFSKPLEIEDDLFMSDETPEQEDNSLDLPNLDETLDDLAPTTEPTAAPMLGDYISQDKEYLEKHQVAADYKYNPQIAADELGLPVDLIEEFIGDFIAQSHDFHDELFESSAKEDFDNVRILSHKLKGVAANLRIEDAFEMLSIINTSNDPAEIEANLRAYYRIVAHLEGKELDEVPQAPVAEEAPMIVEDDLLPTEETFIQEEQNTPEIPQVEKETLPELEDTELEDLYALDVKEPLEDLTPVSQEDDLYDLGIKQDDDEPLLVVDEPEAEPLLDDTLDALEPLSYEDELEPLSMNNNIEAPLTEEVIPTEDVAPLQYDAQGAANELGLDAELVQGIISDFASEASNKRATFDSALADNDAALWQQTARELKGVTDNLRMTDLSSALQSILKTNHSDEAAKAVNQFFNYVNQL